VNFLHKSLLLYDKNGSIATKLAHDGLQVSVHLGCAQGQGQRSRDTGTFVIYQKSLLLAGWIAPKLAHDDIQPNPGEHASRVCSRSRARDLYDSTKIASSSSPRYWLHYLTKSFHNLPFPSSVPFSSASQSPKCL